MKQFILVSACILLLSCGNSKAPKPDYNFVKRDTVVALVNVNWYYNGFSNLRTAREIKYVDKMVDVDSNTQKKQRVLDTLYKVYWIEVARDSSGKVFKTVSGLDSLYGIWVDAADSIIIRVEEYHFPKR